MSKHTPGPWFVETHVPVSPTGVQVSAFEDDGNRVARFVVESFRPKGDASLIAAAPELLSILKTLCALDESEVFVKRPWEETFAEARAAIAKATGENT